MKTILAIVVMAALYLPVPTIHANHEMHQAAVLAFSNADLVEIAMLIGSGRIRSKNGNNYVVQSDDGNAYSATSEESYDVGDAVYHSEPAFGTVEILGHAD